MKRVLLERINRGCDIILIIYEAQNPSFAVLAQIRRQPKPETDKQKLRQVVLIGQPELNEIPPPPRGAAPAQLRSLRVPPGLADRPRARWGAPAHARRRHRAASLHPLGPPLPARRQRGIPRIINHLCDQTPLAASIRESDEVTSWDPRRVVREF